MCNIPHLYVDPYKGIRIPESEKFLLVESVIQLKESRFQVPLTKNLEFSAWEPESKTVLDSPHGVFSSTF